MVDGCRSRIIPVKTESDLTMARTPIPLQARIKRLFLKNELDTQTQNHTNRTEPHLNWQAGSNSGSAGIGPNTNKDLGVINNG